ncbi:unnamed protein product [Schistosoma mattheei]|uniref:SFR19-like C-terminal domain-containing protein n=1 Tax=Schistosoma mattheei TaxID=31246 RepID=A0AA85BI70_9TREM|nr:unnamed protein product [Schistosoma mattheei]
MQSVPSLPMVMSGPGFQTTALPPPPPPPPPTFAQQMQAPASNLLETLMSKAGLPCNTLSDLNLNNKPNDKPDSVRESSPMKQINKLLSSAASSLLNQLAGNQRTDVDTSSSDPLPPPPPPPLPFQQHNELPPTTSTLSHSFVPPPLPAVINPFSNNEIGDKVLPNGACGETKTESKKPFGDMKIEEVLAKRKRYDFSSRREWQERIALEVKSVLKPAYSLRRINKEDYKEIMKKAVTKVRGISKCILVHCRFREVVHLQSIPKK